MLTYFASFSSKDPSILECAWLEVLERDQWATMEEIAEVI